MDTDRSMWAVRPAVRLGFAASSTAEVLVFEAGFITLEGIRIGVAIALVASYGFVATGADWAEGMTSGVPVVEVLAPSITQRAAASSSQLAEAITSTSLSRERSVAREASWSAGARTDDEGPEILLPSPAEGPGGRRRRTAEVGADEQQHLATGIGDRVECLGQQR